MWMPVDTWQEGWRAARKGNSLDAVLEIAGLLSAAWMWWLGPCWRLSLLTANHDVKSWFSGVRDSTQLLHTTAFQHSLPHSHPLCKTRHIPSGLKPSDWESCWFLIVLEVDFLQRPPACLAFPASSDSASVGLWAAMRGRSVTASSQLTPSSPPSRPSSSSHHQGSTGCCLSTDSYPPAAMLSSVLSALEQEQPAQPPGPETPSPALKPPPPQPSNWLWWETWRSPQESCRFAWGSDHAHPLSGLWGVPLLGGRYRHTYTCQLKNRNDESLSSHSGTECMRFKDSLLGSHPGSGLDQYKISLQQIPASHTGHTLCATLWKWTATWPFSCCETPWPGKCPAPHWSCLRDIMAPSEASRRQGPLLRAVEVYEGQSSLATSRVGEVCSKLVQESWMSPLPSLFSKPKPDRPGKNSLSKQQDHSLVYSFPFTCKFCSPKYLLP